MSDVVAEAADSATPSAAAPADAVEGAEPAATRRSLPHRIRLGFRRFRRSRPFWGSVILLSGAYFIGDPIVGGGFGFVVDLGAKALTPLLIAFGMGAAALVALFLPAQRHFPAIVAAGLSVASLPLANLGGWIIGMAAGIVGSSLIFGWAPYSEKQLSKFAAKAERKAQRAAGRPRRRRIGRASAGQPTGN
jgi:hypothetical protein